MKIVLDPNFLYVKKKLTVSLISTDPNDSFVFDIKGVASEMFLYAIEQKMSEDQIIRKIMSEYADISETQIKADLHQLIKYLADNKIVQVS